MLRKTFGTLAGLIVAIVIALGAEWSSSLLYTLPDIEEADAASMASVAAGMPFHVKLVIIAGWYAAGFGGAWLALRITDWRPSAWGVVLGVILFVVVFVMMGSGSDGGAIPYPHWMQACAILLPALGGWLAWKVHRKPYAGEALLG